ncbi:small ribosomal subunit Rsm22 protein [Cardiosporidium cionae]|uniref:Small ribosomal subunit Rsm22 protein n=1 Tax=Cardiosporidium cionae TaxID=476202 RepID=A0ABQ7JBM3_9APIC|nr:small ribosomal subunit Rsm22 protein [Cardiosporidium cionae]|eukprot:KAF8821397.1 small ribosomal subunit Rsm22 protein [Cardiosporidium cionae]
MTSVFFSCRCGSRWLKSLTLRMNACVYRNSNVGKITSITSRRSFAVFRGFRFDRIGESDSVTPEQIIEADDTAMVALKTLAIPQEILHKIEIILKEFGHKHDLERVGSFLARKLTARSSVEIPRILHSSLMTEEIPRSLQIPVTFNKGKADGSASQSLQAAEPDPAELYFDAVAHAEDSRHKLHNITYFPEAALSFMAHRYAGMFAANYRILTEIKKRAFDFVPRSLMEYHAGIAPGIAAAHSIWDGGFLDALAIESSTNLSQLGQYLTSDYPFVRWQYGLYENSEYFDLIVLNYSLSDLPNHVSRRSLVRNLWNRISKNGILAIIECGTPTGFRYIHNIRELFISELGKERFHFVSPCPHESVCPMALTGRDWCHFSQTVSKIPNNLYNKSKNQKRQTEEEKFSYLVIRKGPGPREVYGHESKAPDIMSKSYFWPRIVLPVIKAGRHVLMDVCTLPHSFQRKVVTKRAPEMAGYSSLISLSLFLELRHARKAMWGDLWRFPLLLHRPEARSYTPDEIKKSMLRFEEKTRQAKHFEAGGLSELKEQFDRKSQQHFGQ